MTLEAAKKSKKYLEEIENLNKLDGRIRSLHKDSNIEALATIALELSIELIKQYEDKIREL